MKRALLRVCVTAFVLALIQPACRKPANPRSWATLTTVQHSAPTEGVQRVRVENRTGRVNVVGGNETGVHIEAEVRVEQGRVAGISQKGEFADHVRVEMSAGTLLIADAHAGQADAGDWQLYFTIRVPLELAVDVELVTGDVRIENVRGPLQVSCATGSANIKGDSLASVRASVSVGELAITCDQVRGELAADVERGKAAIRLKQPPPKDVQVTCGVGEVVLDLPPESPGEYDLSTSVGEVKIDGLSGMRVERKLTSAWAKGRVGAGGPVVRLSCQTGKVAVE